jgi:lycopene cyclase domain-containing protein
LNQKYLYLTLNLLSFIVPFLFSFHPKANFFKKWKYVIPGILITAILFVIWDEVFTRMGVWGFNDKYVTGIRLLSLPLEEVLFFFCIPYACLFTYFALNYLVEKDHLFPHQEIISSIIIVVCLVLGMYFMDKAYTGVTFMATGLFVAWHLLKLRPRYMGRFYFAFIFILVPFFIVNGILTGSFLDEPVVWYNDEENLGIRIGTIPIEDLFYGLLMVLMSITIAEELERREVY